MKKVITIYLLFNTEPKLQNVKAEVSLQSSDHSSQSDNYLEKLKLVASLLPSTLDHVSDILSRFI
jgi:hypothetical protein